MKICVAHGDCLISAGLIATLGSTGGLEVAVWDRQFERSGGPARWQSADVAVTDYDQGLNLLRSSAGQFKVLILTDRETESHIRRALEIGARGYLLYGCSAPELLEGVHAVSAGGTALSPRVTARIADSLTHEALTARELDVVALLVIGHSNKAIARELHLSVGTVKSHVKAILAKLNAVGRTEAAAIARHRGIVHGSIRPRARLNSGGQNVEFS